MVYVDNVVSTWGDMSLLVRHVELRLSQMGFVRCGPVRITVGVELAKLCVSGFDDVELPFESVV